MDLDLVLRGGTLVTTESVFSADVGIAGGKIALVQPGLTGRETRDVSGMLVLPGGVDPHVHLETPVGATCSSDDWVSGSRAAACGGTTTLVDFVESDPGENPLAALVRRRQQAEGRAVLDFGLHMTLRDDRPETLNAVPAVIASGCPTFKTYLVYEGFALSDAAFANALRAVAQAGGLTLVHAEDQDLVSAATQRLLDASQTGPQAHAASRPAEAEIEAIRRALRLADAEKAPLYVVHVSTAGGAAEIAWARRRGQAAFGETCPQYLLLNAEHSTQPGFEAAKYVCAPPLRTPADQEGLWQALAQGELHSLGTDHCPFNFHGQKDLGRADFTQIPAGLPGIEARLALLYTFGVRPGRLSLSRWVELCSTAPAHLMGLYPRKGALVPGADADLVVFDPEQDVLLADGRLHERVDYTPYAGLRLRGWPLQTYLRGRLIAERGEFVGASGGGHFLARSKVRYASIH